MNIMSRRTTFSAIFGGLAAAILPSRTLAQYTEQEVSNGLSVVSTGDVTVDQAASGVQEVDINGTLVSGDGVYQTSTGNVVVNDGRIVATGDVDVSQSASGNQSVAVYSGMPASACNPGHVIADPSTGQLFYQGNDCCYYEACAVNCKRCQGGCG